MEADFGSSGYAPIVTLRGEIGTSMVRERDIKIKLGFAGYLLNSGNELVREVFESMIGDRVSKRWLKIVNGYRDLLGISYGQLDRMKGEELRNRIWEHGFR